MSNQDIHLNCSVPDWSLKSAFNEQINSSNLRFRIIHPPEPQPVVRRTIVDARTIAITIGGEYVNQGIAGVQFECYVSNDVKECYIERDVEGFYLLSELV